MENLVSKERQEVIGLVLPMLKDIDKLEAYWEKAAAQIWERLAAGQDCAFINVGDPLLYGTFIHILRTLQKLHPDVNVEVIPGISSVSAAAARSIVPLAINDERLAIIPADSDEKFIRATLEDYDTVAFMKVNTAFDRLLSILEDMKLTSKCVYIRRCSTQNEEIVRDVKQLKGKKNSIISLSCW